MAVAGRSEIVTGWIASLPEEALSGAVHLRDRPGIEVCQEDGTVWFRGSQLDDGLVRDLRSLLGCRIFLTLDDGQLVPLDETVPCGHAPRTSWSSLRNWLELSLCERRFAAPNNSRIALSLTRSSVPKEPSLMRVSLEHFSNYALTAPRIRLEQLQFAASARRAVVLGKPLPPLRGEYFYLSNGVAAPVGYRWEPALDAAVLRDFFQLEEGDIAMLLPEDGCTVIKNSQIIGATRSAVRLTAGGLRDES